MKNFWVSWYCPHDLSGFELNSPWWISGYIFDEDEGIDVDIICSAIKAENEHLAAMKIYESFDQRPDHINFRFIEERPDDWSPYCDRFPKANWMVFE